MLNINRYRQLATKGEPITPPFIPIPLSPEDKYEEFRGTTATMIDALSEKWYDSSAFSWVIMYANPQYMNEADPEVGDIIRIPYPLETAIEAYENGLNDINNL
jgi:rRNA maturation protein Nop10